MRLLAMEQGTESRRQFFVRAGAVLVGGGMFAAGLASRQPAAPASRQPGPKGSASAQAERAPAGFVAHGAPTLALDALRGAPLADWGRKLAATNVQAVLMVSAHWERAPVTLGVAPAGREQHELIYDFSGFPAELYRFEYRAPIARGLVEQVSGLLAAKTRVEHRERGLDHGAWVPLVHLAPHGALPVLQVSMPSTLGAAALFKLGELLAPLRQRGVFILGSGNLVHNLRRLDFSETRPPESWAQEFDAWVAQVLAARDYDALIDYRNRAPGVELAHPTPEHYLPLLIAAGAASGDAAPPSTVLSGFEYGNISRRSLQFG